MNRVRSFVSMAVLLLLLSQMSHQAHAMDGFPIRITKNATQIKIKTRVVGTASRDMLLWVSKLSEDKQWAWVKVPSSDQWGWMNLGNAASVEVPAASKQAWDDAASYFPKWQQFINAGKYIEAAEVARSSGDTMNRLLEESVGALYPGYPPASTAYNQSAVALLGANRPTEALELFQQAIKTSAASLGSQHAETCVHRANAAEARVHLDQFAAAIQEFDISLPVLESQALATVNLDSYYLLYGKALAKENRIFDAKLAFGKALRLTTKRHGERSVEVAQVAAMFSAAMDLAGQHDDATKQLVRSLDVYRQLLDPEDPIVIDTLNRLSAYNARANNFPDAKRYAQEAVAIQRELDAPPVFQLASSLNNLGLALARQHEFEKAETILLEALDLMATATEKGSFASSFPMKNLGILALEQEENDKAKSLFQQVLKIREASQSTDHTSVGAANALLGEVAVQTENLNVARKHLMEAVRIQGNDLGIDHPDTRRTITSLRNVIIEDPAAQEDLDLLIVTARQKLRKKVMQERPDTWYKLDSIAQEYRLQRVLAGKLTSTPPSEFYPLEVTAETSIRTGGLLSTNISAGSIVYAFRAENGQALIKIPEKEAVGWIAKEKVREVVYSPEVRTKLEAAQRQLDIGWADQEKGDFKTATARIRAAIETFETELGEQSAFLASARYMLGSVLAAAGEAKTAVEECRKAEAVLVEVLGETHGETAMARNNLADALLAMGRPAEALRPAALALQTISGFGEDRKSEQALFAGNAGLALGALSHYEAAREYLEHGLQLAIEANGENHRDAVRCYVNLGSLHVAMHEYESAEAAFGKAFRISERVNGATHPDTTAAMLKFGEALVNNQKIPAGRKMIEQSATINLQNRGPLDQSTIESDYAKASLAASVGDTSSARRLMQSVLNRSQKRLGDDNPALIHYQEALGKVLFADGDYEAALKEIRETTTAFRNLLGEENHETIDSINSVGVCSAALGRLDVARVQFERALRLGQKILGPDHPDTTSYLFNIGEVALMAKDYVAARPRIEAAIEGFEKGTQVIHSKNCVARTMLGYVDVGQGDTDAAMKTFDTAAHDTFEMISNVLPALSEKEQLMFLQGDFRDMHDAWLTLSQTSPRNGNVSAATAAWHLNMKGSSHELLATQARRARDSSSISNQTAFKNLIKVRESLARLSLRSVPPDARAAHNEAISKLSTEEQRLSREIGNDVTSVTKSREWLDLPTYRKQIPARSVVVNFARIRNANFQFSSERSKWKGDRYVAWIISPGADKDVVTVDLGLAEGIDRRISSTLQSLHSPQSVSRITSDGEQSATKIVHEELSGLAAKVLLPLMPYLDGAEELILSPDGQLWTIPWAALPVSEDKYALESYRIRFVVTGRELADSPKNLQTPVQTTAPLIVANPRFEMSATSTVLADSRESNNRLRSVATRFSDSFRTAKPLPGTAAEAEAIRTSLESYAGAAPEMFLQQTAEERVVKSAHSPFCVVLSTHGFFFEAPRAEATSSKLEGARVVSDNPLLRCGLLLAGCHHAESAPVGTDDGVLTGMEIISSDLRDTELVVLSACETGLGDLRCGEGVAGLRQAFQLAGAKSVVASLWQVEDLATSRLMDQFFQNLAKGMTKSEALRQAQISRIKVRRERYGAAHPFFWAAFTLTGED